MAHGGSTARQVEQLSIRANTNYSLLSKLAWIVPPKLAQQVQDLGLFALIPFRPTTSRTVASALLLLVGSNSSSS
jgi:hypothetical protein